MARLIAPDYTAVRKLLTGSTNPSGLTLVPELDGNLVSATLIATPDQCGGAKVVPTSLLAVIAEDIAYAALAALRKQVGIIRELKLTPTKPLYVGEAVRADCTVLRAADEVVVFQVRMINPREQLGLDATVEMFALSADKLRKMSPDGQVPADLKKYVGMA